MLEKLQDPKQMLTVPDENVIEKLQEVLQTNPDPVFYEIGVGIGATTLAASNLLANRGKILLFSRDVDVQNLANDLRDRGFTNIDRRWGSPNNTYSGYHFELARGFVAGDLPMFDVAYIDGGHVFHLDAPATCVLKELCKPGGYMLFDDWYWSLSKSPGMKPEARPKTAEEYDAKQIETAHVQLVCKALMDTDKRFEFIKLVGGTAIYRRKAD